MLMWMNQVLGWKTLLRIRGFALRLAGTHKTKKQSRTHLSQKQTRTSKRRCSSALLAVSVCIANFARGSVNHFAQPIVIPLQSLMLLDQQGADFDLIRLTYGDEGRCFLFNDPTTVLLCHLPNSLHRELVT